MSARLSISLTYYRHLHLTGKQEQQLLLPEKPAKMLTKLIDCSTNNTKCRILLQSCMLYPTSSTKRRGKHSDANPFRHTLQKAMMSPMIQLAAGFAAAPAASTESK